MTSYYKLNCSEPPISESQRYRADWHFDQNLLQICQYAKNESMSSIHQIILKLQLILESHDQIGHTFLTMPTQ